MEYSMGGMIEEEWSGLNGMYYSTEEAEFVAQLFVNSSSSSTFCPGYEYSTANMAENIDHFRTNVHSSGCGSSNSTFFPISSHDQFFEMKSNQNTGSQQVDQVPWGTEVFMNFLNKEEMSCCSVEESGWNAPEVVLVHGKNLPLIGRQSEMPPPETSVEDKNDNFLSENTKKRSSVSGDNVRRKKNVKSKKNQKINNGETNTAGLNTQKSTSSCSLEDESNASQELNDRVTSSSSSKGASTLNLNGKTRASRGSATDPQSLYARRRRERINERLRILQSLVPNGTKVDISTMLEEAVRYVKFLQLLIKLLSSDELWMYAPIAYNGMDIGLDLNIRTPR